MNENLRDVLRRIPSLTGTAPEWDMSALPPTPEQLFTEWLSTAIASDVPEAAAVTVATVDAQGMPDARTLILKEVGESGWAFAGTATSTKGRQLAHEPRAAINIWWQPLVRAVRARGIVVEAPSSDAEADLAARSADARALVAPGDWRLWRLIPEEVEFWQGAADRRHLRVKYLRAAEGWRMATVA
jgi:pyridoxamine 5'-phosphate oxidase